MSSAVVPAERIEDRILVLRGHKVLIDSDLAALYNVDTRRLNEQVKRNRERFPKDFIFELTSDEFANLKSQIATSSSTRNGSSAGHGGRRKLPLAFTEHGAIMAATVVNSPRAVEMSIYVVRAFVRLREVIASSKELAVKLGELERKLTGHDQAIADILNAIRQLMAPPPAPPKRAIGFVAPQERRRSDER